MKRILQSLCVGLLAIGAPVPFGYGQNISTVAGGGTFGYDPFSLNGYPTTLGYAIAQDPQGRVYFGTTGVLILRINETTGKLDTIAGTGASGYTGDGGPARLAKIETPQSITIDATGNIYFSEIFWHRIRRIDAVTGIITTYAGGMAAGFSGDGGLATSAKLNTPKSLTTDANGNLYFHDASYRIRRVDAVTKIITTFGGNGTFGYSGDNGLATAASFGERIDLACDPAGNVLVGDGPRIRKINAGTNMVTTIAGTGSVGFSGDGGLASAATINSVLSLVVNSTGDLFFLDAGNYRIRKITQSTQIISTISGNGNIANPGTDNGDGGPTGNARIGTDVDISYTDLLSLSANGTIHFLEFNTGRLRRLVPSGNVTLLYGRNNYYGNGIPPREASLNSPASICHVDNALFIAEQVSARIRKVDMANNTIHDFAGIGYSATTGNNGPALLAGIGNPYQVKSDTEGNLYIPDLNYHVIRRIDKTTGIISSYAGIPGVNGYSGDSGPATSATLNAPSAIAFDSDNNLYIADRGNRRIRKVTKATGVITTFAGNGTQGSSGDGGLALNASFTLIGYLLVGPTGDLYISDWGKGLIRKISKSTGIIKTIMGDGTFTYPGDGLLPIEIGLNAPYGLAFDEIGNFYVAAGNSNRILRVDSITQRVYTIGGTGKAGYSGDGDSAVHAMIYFPRDIIFVGSDLYFVDAGNNRIRKIENPGVITSLNSDLQTQKTFSLFPNPAQETAIIEFKKRPNSELDASIQVFDLMGRNVPLPIRLEGNRAILDVRQLPDGSYVVRFVDSGSQYSQKLVKISRLR